MPTTVDKIRRALEKRDGIAEEEMRPLAETYRSEVQAVNQRLDDSVMLLRKGLRSEAIQRVEMTPNALDAATELEFPEWDEWNEILQFMGVPLPPKLNQDYVSQINEAIIESLPLEDLLKRHRRMAIAKAPLGIRLKTLRQIARVDSANGVWQDDVEEWEKIRLQQIETEMKMAGTENASLMFQLHRELTAAPWRIAPPSRLLEQSTSAAKAHVRENQESILSQIAPKMIAAFDARDEPAARDLRSQWQSARARYNVEVSPTLESQVAAPMQWLEDLDRQALMEQERQEHMSHLVSSLEGEQSIEEVQKAYDQASRFGEPVPEELSERVQKLKAAPEKKRKQKMQLIGAGVLAGVVALAAAGYMFMSSAGAAKAKEATIKQMRSYIDAQQYDQAVMYYNTIQSKDPETASDPQMVGFFTTAQKSVSDEEFRLERFEKLYTDANQAEAGMIDESLLPQLNELAVTDVEKERVAQLVKRKEEFVAGEIMSQSDEMVGRIAKLRSEFGRLQSRGGSPENQQAIRSLLSQITRVPNEFPLHNDEANAKAETLRSQVNSVLKQMKDDGMITEMREDAIESLMSSRSLGVFADQLREYSTASVYRTNFVEFETVLDEEDHWLNVERVNAWLQDDFQSKLDSGLASSEAVSLISSLEALEDDVMPNPIVLAMPQLMDLLTEIRSRKRILDEGFVRIQKHPIGKAITVEEPNGESPTGVMNSLMYATYAAASRSKFQKTGSIGLQVISDQFGQERNRSFNGPITGFSNEPLEMVKWILSDRNKSKIGYDNQWEATFIRQVVEVVRRPGVDGVLKEWLINELLETATQGSSRLKAAIPQTMQLLARRSRVRERWFEPRPKGSDLDPQFSAQLMSELKIAFKNLEAPLAKYQSISEKQLQWIGFLTKSMDGQIEYNIRGTMPEGDGKLFVAVPAIDGDAETSIISVGNLKSGHITLEANPVHQVPGRPIFLLAN